MPQYVTPLEPNTAQVRGFEELEYVGNFTIGTPEQQFALLIDTGSGDTWVTDQTCAS